MEPFADEIVRSLLIDRYRLAPPIEVNLLRAYTNDVYAVRAAGTSYALKLYGLGWRTEPEVAYEVDLLAHLAAHGVSVAQPMPDREGRFVQRVETPAGNRVAVLFTHAPGVKPSPPFSTDLYERVGRAAGAMHRASEDFTTLHSRRPLDTVLLLDQPAALIAPLIADGRERNLFLEIVARLRQTIATFNARGLDWGPCHGDLTLDNLHVTDDGAIIWFDFDSGGPGWRAIDLPGWATFVPGAAPRASAFLHGYRSMRRLDPLDVEASPYLYAALTVWWIQIELERRELAKGDEAVSGFITTSVNALHKIALHLDLV